MIITEWFKKIWEDGKYVEELAVWLKPIKLEELLPWKNGTPKEYGYREFEIPKRSKNGYRKIEAPEESLKKLQKKVYMQLMWKWDKNKTHKACCGFVPGKSIVDAARNHTNKEVVINMDLKDFFHSTSQERVEQYFRKAGWGKTAAKILTNICCYRERLPVGSPTSPALTNLINYPMDVRLTGLAKKFGGDYSRYADDITFSFATFGGKQRLVIRTAMNILREYGYQIQMKKKVRIQRKHQKQTVTGLIVNEGVHLNRKLRRQIRVMVHKKALGILPKDKENQLNGYLAFQTMVAKKV